MSAQTVPELAPLAPGEIRFHQASPPPIPPGDYTLTVTHDLSGPATQSFPATAPFTVSGPRFYLKPTEVYSVYPPAGHFGPFDNALPHIVFTRRTLPWERSIDGAPQKADAPVPWCALLLITAEDFDDGEMPKITSRAVKSLLNPETGVQGPKGLTLEGGETMDDLCNTIDLPAAVYAEIVPTQEDLPFLAHVREVKTGGKETLSLTQDGWFTVVVGNRLPATNRPTKQAPPNVDQSLEGVSNLVCLVSLEGYGSMLPTVDAAGSATVTLGSGNSHIRLAVLASWSFVCHGNNDFKTRMSTLDDTSLLSLTKEKPTAAGDGEDSVRTAFALGYAGLNHTTRIGEKTVSWYRGPLVPLRLDPRSPYAFIPAADRALRYDFQTGLFAAEYAAAFELGRMMALQNRSVASAMYRFRSRVARDLAAEAQQPTRERDLGVPESLRGKFENADSAGYKRYVNDVSLRDAIADLFGSIDKLS